MAINGSTSNAIELVALSARLELRTMCCRHYPRFEGQLVDAGAECMSADLAKPVDRSGGAGKPTEDGLATVARG